MNKFIKYLSFVLILLSLLLGCKNQEALRLQSSNENSTSSSKNLIVYFSRKGNTQDEEKLDATTSASILIKNNERIGSTEYIARLIHEKVGGDIYLIETEDKYPSDYNTLVDYNHKEVNSGRNPIIKELNININSYQNIFIGYPIWATDLPRAVLSFLEEYNITGKKVIPFCTHDGYGPGRSYNSIKNKINNSDMLEALSINSSDIESAEERVEAWLSKLNIQPDFNPRLSIKIGEVELEGILLDTPLAKEISFYFPLEISMSRFSDREYYGNVSFYPNQENLVDGKTTFNNGDITYCQSHHNMALFFSKADSSILSVEVIPIGKITSDLSLFNNLSNRENVILNFKGE